MTDSPSPTNFSDPRLKPLHQEYGAYTSEDFQVWKILFERQYKNLPGAASRKFLEGLGIIGFTAHRIANFAEANERLGAATGWSIQVVPGLIDDDLFFGLLHQRRFPASTWLRSLEQLDYLQEPDMFHDAFAHLPLLTDPAYARFLQDLAGIALKHLDNPLAIDLLSRVYWYTIEFGLIREAGQVKVYGAGILSSAGETQFSLSDEPRHLQYDVEEILNTPYWKNKFQERYFIIDSFEDLYTSIPLIEEKLGELLEKAG
ncbi:phenylalanine 4-monooxygenase [Cyclobacterium xiamenense]|uniref:phenylalanine 4-monooxygenase n=1 Tax=Cyclobacterium xiamenense TaxID=1297121 RepID=UPI0012B72BC5|nr:phenylalanine 4-monooxygenase [Cyclobacterium xiamenense]